MYETFYKLSDDPFRLLPDPTVCFPHRSSSRAWAYLRYALKRGEGVVVVTGPPGSGKTTLAERLLGELNPSKIISVRLVANDLSPADLLRKLAYAFGLPVEGKDRAMLTLLIEKHLIEVERSQRRVLVVIDEAQTLSHNALEAMRLLTDMQSQSRPILQLFLFGQEELEGVMSAPGMEQFQHRVIASCRLQPMDLGETKGYLEYRLTASDWRGDPSLNGPAVMAIHRYSHGVPRHVNKICSRLFLYGSSEEKHALNERDVRLVVSDLRSELLAPLTGDDEPAAPVSTGVFDSVYELALVPSLPRHEEAVRKPVVQHLDSLRLDDDVVAGATAAEPARPSRRPSVRRGVSAGDRHIHHYGRRYRPHAVRRLLRGLRSVGGRARHSAARLWQDTGSLIDGASRFAAKTATRSAELVASSRRWMAGKRPQLEALSARPFWGMPAGRLAGAVIAVSLVGLTGALQSDNTPTLAGVEPGIVNQKAISFGDDVQFSPNVLDGHNAAAVSEDSLEAAHQDGLADLLAGNLLAVGGPHANALSGLLGEGLALPRLSPAAAGAGKTHEDESQQPLLRRISGETSSRLVQAVMHLSSSLNFWALARHPDTVTAEGKEMWTFANSGSGEQTLRVAAFGTEQPAEHDATGEPAAAMPVQTVAENPAQPQSPVETALPPEAPRPVEKRAVVQLAETAPTMQTAASDEPQQLIAEIDIDAATVDDAGLDLTHILPATSAGDSDVVALQMPTFNDAATEQSPEYAQAVVSENGMAVSQSLTDDGSRSLSTAGVDVVATAETAIATVDTERLLAEQRVVEEQARRQQIDALIAKADKAIAANRLLLPEERSAYHYLKEILAIDGSNQAAEERMNRIVRRYADLTKTAIEDELFDKADRFVSRGLRVDPDSARMRNLRNEVAAARAEAEAVALAEAEMARLAAEPAPEPVAPPPKERMSSFQRLMNVVNGF